MAAVAYTTRPDNLGSLADLTPPLLVSASHLLDNGTLAHFNAQWQQQRTALVLTNGNVYAGFGSFCDQGGPQGAPLNISYSRGWLLGWKTGPSKPIAVAPTPLTNSRLNNIQHAPGQLSTGAGGSIPW